MGLLDDAIREHLDLKRRRGADPAEVERAEREALGPVRRGVEPVQEPGQGAEDATAYGVEHAADEDYAPLDEPGWDDSSAPVSDTIEPGPLTFESSETAPPALDEPPPAAAAPPAPVREPEPLSTDPDPIPAAPPPPSVAPPPAASEAPAAVPPPPAPAPPPPSEASQTPPPAPAPAPAADRAVDPDPTGGETVEYDVERALDSEPRHEDEDVLEETPEFLQDTPDHDRLWFEQRPPRDFDFDG